MKHTCVSSHSSIPLMSTMVHTPTITSTYSPCAWVRATVLNLEYEVDGLQVTLEALFRKCLVKIPARTSAILTEGFRSFSQFHQENARRVP
jgi:hypothetical protein